LRFGVNTSRRTKKIDRATPLITTAHQLVEFSALASSLEAALATSTEKTTITKSPLKIQSNMVTASRL